MEKKQRNFVKIVNEVCEEENIDVKSYSSEWIFKLSKGSVSKHIVGHRFELNSCSIDAICNDKSGTAEILADNGIDCVEHKFYISPSYLEHMNSDGNWEGMLKYLNEHKKIVCKPNEGTSGVGVSVVKNKKELEVATDYIFSISRGMALSPYYDIENEYRVIILNDNVKLIFSKSVPSVVGNGKDTVLRLLADSKVEYKRIEFSNYIDFSYIPSENEIVKLNWKHNLGLGASAEIVTDNHITEELSKIAIKAAKILNIKFASIDIIKTENTYKILEINSGFMMEYFSRESEENYKIAKGIYKEAINSMFSKS
ncbi:MAG: hypothetical protein FWC79_08040 [Oscillospiraceae bacterium]|nr:hypothetical protein [Oscillospiraceae bacterium]